MFLPVSSQEIELQSSSWEVSDCHLSLLSCSPSQAVIQGAFTSDDAVDTEGTAAETHYTYFPSTAVGDGAGGTTSGSTAAVVTTQGSEALLGQATPPGTGQFFVMMSPQEVLQGGSQRSIAPRTHPYSP